MKIWFYDFPRPPSANDIWRPAYSKNKRRAFMRPDKQLTDFQKKVDVWFRSNISGVNRAAYHLQAWCNQQPHHMIRVHAWFAFTRDELFQNNSEQKALDGSNYLKALHDCLAKCIAIDDRRFLVGRGDKVMGSPKTLLCLETDVLRTYEEVVGHEHRPLQKEEDQRQSSAGSSQA